MVKNSAGIIQGVIVNFEVLPSLIYIVNKECCWFCFLCIILLGMGSRSLEKMGGHFRSVSVKIFEDGCSYSCFLKAQSVVRAIEEKLQ